LCFHLGGHIVENLLGQIDPGRFNRIPDDRIMQGFVFTAVQNSGFLPGFICREGSAIGQEITNPVGPIPDILRV
jgi:hypothetical protein